MKRPKMPNFDLKTMVKNGYNMPIHIKRDSEYTAKYIKKEFDAINKRLDILERNTEKRSYHGTIGAGMP